MLVFGGWRLDAAYSDGAALMNAGGIFPRSRTRVDRRRPGLRAAAWPIATLVLMFASFAVGRHTGGFHSFPAIAATLPGEEADFSRELDERIRALFPVGSSEEKLIDYLASEMFTPEWRRRDDSNASAFVWNGLVCKRTVRVFWRADAAGLLTEVSGTYQSDCL
jgi:hypothetical protein